MAGSDKTRSSRRDRDRDRSRDGGGRRRKDRDSSSDSDRGDRRRRDSSPDEVIPYKGPRDRDRRPPARRNASYNDGIGAPEYFDSDSDDDRYHAPRDRHGSRRPPARRTASYNDGNGASEYFDSSEDDEDYRRRSAPRSSGRQKGGGGGGVVDSRKRRPRSETASRAHSRTRSRSRDRDRDRPLSEADMKSKRNQAIKAALTAGAVEAFRQRNRPGEWVGQKGMRVATAAISAGLIDAGLDKNPGQGSGTMGRLMKSTLGGLVVDKLANGGRR